MSGFWGTAGQIAAGGGGVICNSDGSISITPTSGKAVKVDGPINIQNAGGLAIYSNGNAPGYIFTILSNRSHGTFSVPTAVVSGDTIAQWAAQGYNNGGYQSSAMLDFAVDAAPGATQVPGRIGFLTATSVLGPIERARFDSEGNFMYYGVGVSGQALGIKSITELTTIAAAASTDTGFSIPINAVVLAVSVFVKTVIPTAATFTVTGATSGTAFNTAAVLTAAGSSNAGTENCPYKNGAAQLIRITPNAAPAAATGQVRVTLYYYDSTPPTS